MSEEELSELMQVDNEGSVKAGQHGSSVGKTTAAALEKSRGNDNLLLDNSDNASEATVYRRAVRRDLDPGAINSICTDPIEQMISNIRQQGEKGNNPHKVSSSSDELMDTSDETDLNFNVCIADMTAATPGKSTDPQYENTPKARKTPEQHAEEIVKNAERSRAKLYEVPGKEVYSVAKIDKDYQVIDAHVEEAIQIKIQSFEYVDLSKLLQKHKIFGRDKEQRMEFVTKNGFTYLSPISERDMVQINSYHKWEQAFRIYCNILTAKFPGKANELFQYSHTIQTASMAYHWENVYAYDKEFCQHIGRNPQRSWGVILQQAWTMLLKDRICNQSNHLFQKGNFSGGKGNKKDQEPCRRFNRGKSTFELSCKFDHRCSVPKCGKFGHSAHICRLRDSISKPNHDRPAGESGGHGNGTDPNNS